MAASLILNSRPARRWRNFPSLQSFLTVFGETISSGAADSGV